MKKSILTIILGLTLNLISAQSFLRSIEFTIGAKKPSGILWEEAIPSDVLIVVEENKIVIHSTTKQEYRKINQIQKTDTNSKWRSIDATGKACNIFMFVLPDYPGYLYVGIEYGDIVWYYTTVLE